MSSARFVLLAVISAMLLAACGGTTPIATSAPTQAAATDAATDAPPDAPSDTQPPSEGEPTPGTALTACEVVTPADIEAALELEAGSVDEGELEEAATVLDPNRNVCRYEGEWGGLLVDLLPTDGVNAFDAVESTFGEDAEVLDMGEGALWFEDNNRGYFLLGPVMVLLQYTFLTGGDFESFREPTVALGEAALDKL